MKKIVTLLLAAGLVFSAASQASAVEVKVSGMMDFTFESYKNTSSPFMSNKNHLKNYGETQYQKNNAAMQRLRIGVDFIASESLRAHYMAQVGTFSWGGRSGYDHEKQGGQLGTRSGNISTRFAYLDWIIPNTKVQVRMGQQPFATPGYTFGTPVVDDPATGIVVSIPVNDNITVTPLWVRAVSDYRNYDGGKGYGSLSTTRRSDTSDIFGLMADFQYDGWAVSPYALYAATGKDAIGEVTDLVANWDGSTAAKTDTWFVGFGGELTRFEPFRFTIDAVYGSSDSKSTWVGDNKLNQDREGWYVALGAEYQLPAYGVLGLKGWYASGDDGKTSNGSERLPSISASMDATSTYWDGGYTLTNNIARGEASGTWGIQLAWTDISFVDKLSHDFSVTYVEGTNNRKMVRNGFMAKSDPSSYLTSKDSLVEINLNSTYDIYQNLAAVLELAYVFQDFDKSVWGQGWESENNRARFNDAWRASLNFKYSF